MKATIDNTSMGARRGWVTVTVPTPLARELPAECEFFTDEGVALRAAKGRERDHHTVFRVFVPYLAGRNRITGTIRAPREPVQAEAFRFHPWVSDDLAAMVPDLMVAVDGRESQQTGRAQVVVLERSATLLRVRVEKNVPAFGLRVVFWIDVLHNSASAPFRCRIVWSDRKDPSVTSMPMSFALRCRELTTIRHGARRGVSRSFRVGSEWATHLTREPIAFTDGMALAFSGEILAGDSSATPVHPDQWTIDERMEFDSHLASEGGFLVGVCHDWDGHYCAAGHTPKLTFQSVLQHAQADLGQLMADGYRGWLAPRHYGLTASPGQSGAQDDFGAAKGTLAVVDPFIAPIIFLLEDAAHGDMLRGYHHFENDGSMVTAAAHPNWTTWGGVTHFHVAVSMDRLGKNGAPMFPAGAWFGVDDEHASRNCLAAYLTLADDPMVEEAVTILAETERAAYRLRFPQFGAGAARAQGRTVGALAQLAIVSDPHVRERFVEVLTARVAATRAVLATMTGSMKVLAVGSPDPRKDVFNPDGSRAEWVSLWEHALALVGFVQALRACDRMRVEVPGLADVVRTIASTLVDFAFFQAPGPDGRPTWWIVDDLRWNNGESVELTGAVGRREAVANVGLRGVGNWTFAGLLAARNLLALHPRKSELNALVSFVTNNDTATDRFTAEWWAIAGL